MSVQLACCSEEEHRLKGFKNSAEEYIWTQGKRINDEMEKIITYIADLRNLYSLRTGNIVSD
jgi:hypothetical protein